MRKHWTLHCDKIADLERGVVAVRECEQQQDGETKAFKRLAKELKRKHPRLPICILGDSLYASEPVFKICDENGWKFLIRFKEGSIKSVAREFNIIKDLECEKVKTASG
jgi:hypothetical protein